MTQYLKTITALVTALIGWATLVVESAPSEITSTEWILLATAVTTALGVYLVPNIGGPPLTDDDPGD